MSKIIRLSQPDCANTSPKSNNFNKNTHRHRHIYTHTHTRNYTIAITRLERAKFVNGSNPKGDTTYISVYKINKTFIFYMLFHMNITCDLDLSGDFFFFFFCLFTIKMILIQFQVLSVVPGLLLLTLSWQRSLSNRNQSTDLQSKTMDWFLYDRGLLHGVQSKVKTG